jgi:predicted GNAT family acetyltransferase
MQANKAFETALMSSAVRDNPARSRFELEIDGTVAIANYRIAGDAITIFHTETPAHLRGRGIASRLMEGVVEIVKARGLKVVPRCAFAEDYFAKHPELSDLLA